MSIVVNQSVVTGLPALPIDASYGQALPTPATPACLSQADSAPWTNRVPNHEPWPRTMEGNSIAPNAANSECDYNTHHNPQFVDDNGKASQSIGTIEGNDVITRNPYWRR